MVLKKVNITIDNINPLITYAPPEAWREGDTSDAAYSNYDHQGTFTLTQTLEANASFTFYGVEVWVFGAKRANHGAYQVTLDGHTYKDTGKASPDLFQTVLFHGAGLKNTKHTVVLTDADNTPNLNFLDVDSITYQTVVDSKVDTITQQDDADSFDYSGVWSGSAQNSGSYSGGTGHTTSADGAYVEYSFNGSAVQIYGTAGPNNGGYSVKMDNGTYVSYNATKSSSFFQTLIYEINGLKEGAHKVTVVNRPYVNGQQLNIDYAVVNHNSTSTSSDDSSESSVSGAAIGGIVAGVVVLIAAIVAGVFFMRRRKRSAGGVYDLGTPAQMYELNPNSAEPLGSGRPDLFYSPYHTSIAQSRGSGYDSTLDLNTSRSGYQPSSAAAAEHDILEDPFASNHGHSDYETPRREEFTHNPSESLSNSDPFQTASRYQSSAQPSTPAGRLVAHNHSASLETTITTVVSETSTNPRGGGKGLQNPWPRGANQTLAHVPRDDLEASRMRVEGRPQDFGAVPLDHEVVPLDDLPPDYNQATEPFRAR